MEPGGRRPAPEPLAAVQRFVNTLDIEGGSDLLSTPAALGSWLQREGLLNVDVDTDQTDLARAIVLREGFRALLAASAGHAAPEHATAIARTRRVLADLPLYAAPNERWDLTSVPFGADPVARALAQLVAIALEASADGRWRRLKVCTRSACQWAFYDWSKNLSGVWCSMKLCGTTVKKQAYVERRRQRRTTCA